MKKVMKLLMALTIFLYLFAGGCGNSPPILGPDELDLAIRDASDYLNGNIPEGSMIVILNMQSDSAALSDYCIDELIANAVNDRIFKVVDRQQLDLIRTEQNFQLSGEVDDNLALSIGKFFGAQTIVSGRVSQVGDRYRMTIRALDVQTAQVQGQYNRNIAAGKTITELMRSVGGTRGGTQTAAVRTTGSGNSGTVTGGTTASGSGGGAARIVPTITSVTISPESISVDKGKTHQFSATVTGTNDADQSVIWTVYGNTSGKTTISEDGILTVAADENATPLTVTAASTFDRSKNSKAVVEVPGGIAALSVNNIATWNTAINKIRNGGNNQTYIISVTGAVAVPTVDEPLFGSVTGLTVTIQGGGTLSISNTTGALLRIGARQTVIARNITLQGRSDNGARVVIIMSRGEFRMEDNALVKDNSNWAGGGGVAVEGGTFIMQGGEISNNRSGNSGDGGGVRVSSGTFTMDGGKISNNTSLGPAAGIGGGGVYVGSGGTFIMRGGTILENTGGDRFGGGGGVYIQGGTFNMQGGTISGNTTNGNGGGVCVRYGTFTKTGGTIYGNDSGQNLSNTASSGQGHALHEGSRWRNATAGPDDNTGGYGFWMND